MIHILPNNYVYQNKFEDITRPGLHFLTYQLPDIYP